MYDIALIGLGPAGSFFAGHIDKGYKVIAIDKKVPGGGGFEKPCGGLLAPDAQRSLSRFSMTLPKDILVSPQIFSVRTIDVKTGLVRHYQRHYINLNRHKFDIWLMSKIPGHVEVCTDSACTGIVRDEEGYRIAYTTRGEPRAVRARYVVGADGAHSMVRRALFGGFAMRKYLAVQQWFTGSDVTPFYSCVFDPDITDSYAWGLTKDDSFVFGGAFAVETAARDFEALKEKMRPYGFALHNPAKTESCLVLRPSGPAGYCLGGDDAFLIGEAAGFISPSSLEGISYAIDSGYLLSRCFNGRNPAAYARNTRGIRLKLLSKAIKRPFMYHPLARRIIMKSGLSSVSVIE